MHFSFGPTNTHTTVKRDLSKDALLLFTTAEQGKVCPSNFCWLPRGPLPHFSAVFTSQRLPLVRPDGNLRETSRPCSPQRAGGGRREHTTTQQQPLAQERFPFPQSHPPSAPSSAEEGSCRRHGSAALCLVSFALRRLRCRTPGRFPWGQQHPPAPEAPGGRLSARPGLGRWGGRALPPQSGGAFP